MRLIGAQPIVVTDILLASFLCFKSDRLWSPKIYIGARLGIAFSKYVVDDIRLERLLPQQLERHRLVWLWAGRAVVRATAGLPT